MASTLLFVSVELSTFTRISDLDCPGHTLETHSGGDAEECASYCYQTPDCLAFTWQDSNPFPCNLKRKCDPFPYNADSDTYVRSDGKLNEAGILLDGMACGEELSSKFRNL